jgi:hypothetical protein
MYRLSVGYYIAKIELDTNVPAAGFFEIAERK